MNQTQKDFAQVLSEFSIPNALLPDEEAAIVYRNMRRAFSEMPGDEQTPLWETMISSTGLYEDKGDRFLQSFLSSNSEEILFIIQDWYRMTGFKIQSSKLLYDALKSTYRFVWYSTNSLYSYVLCQNDHNFVIYSSNKDNLTSKIE